MGFESPKSSHNRYESRTSEQKLVVAAANSIVELQSQNVQMEKELYLEMVIETHGGSNDAAGEEDVHHIEDQSGDISNTQDNIIIPKSDINTEIQKHKQDILNHNPNQANEFSFMESAKSARQSNKENENEIKIPKIQSEESDFLSINSHGSIPDEEPNRNDGGHTSKVNVDPQHEWNTIKLDQLLQKEIKQQKEQLYKNFYQK